VLYNTFFLVEVNMAITTEQIFEVANQLVADGQVPTLARVRQNVGGGSFTTISEAMSQWREKRRATVAEAKLFDGAPAAFSQLFKEMGSKVWTQALELANQSLAAKHEQLAVQQRSIEGVRAETEEFAEQLSAELEQAKILIATLNGTVGAAQAEIADLRSKLTSFQERATMTAARADELRGELDYARENLLQLRTERDKFQDQADTLMREFNKEQLLLQTELIKAQTKANTLEQAYQDQRATIDTQARQHTHQLAAIQSECDRAERDTTRAREEAATLRGQVAVLKTMLADVQTQMHVSKLASRDTQDTIVIGES
jgi:chromosome segregation ATPase